MDHKHGFGYLSLVNTYFDNIEPNRIPLNMVHVRVVDTKTSVIQMEPNLLNVGKKMYLNRY